MLTAQLHSGSTTQKSEQAGCVLSRPKRSESACLKPNECPHNSPATRTTRARNCLSHQFGASPNERVFISPFSKMTCCSHADHLRDNCSGITKACRQSTPKIQRPSCRKSPESLLCTNLTPFSPKQTRIYYPSN